MTPEEILSADALAKLRENKAVTRIETNHSFLGAWTLRVSFTRFSRGGHNRLDALALLKSEIGDEPITWHYNEDDTRPFCDRDEVAIYVVPEERRVS